MNFSFVIFYMFILSYIQKLIQKIPLFFFSFTHALVLGSGTYTIFTATFHMNLSLPVAPDFPCP